MKANFFRSALLSLVAAALVAAASSCADVEEPSGLDGGAWQGVAEGGESAGAAGDGAAAVSRGGAGFRAVGSSRTVPQKVGFGGSRTILPTSAAASEIVLRGTRSGDGEIVILQAADEAALSSVRTLEIQAGTWDFTLSATLGGIPLSGSLEGVSISEGEPCSLRFTLAAATQGSLSVSFSLSGLADGVSYSAEANVVKVGGTEAAISRSLADAAVRGGFTLAGALDAGTYLVSVVLKYAQAAEDEKPLNTFETYARISGGLSTEAALSLDINEVRKITYLDDDGSDILGKIKASDDDDRPYSLPEGAVLRTAFSRKGGVVFPNLVCGGKAFLGWRLGAADGEEIAGMESPSESAGDVTLYARWMSDTLYVKAGGTGDGLSEATAVGSIADAVGKIVGLGAGSADWKIIVCSSLETAQKVPATLTAEDAKSLSIKDASIGIKNVSGTGLTVSTAVPLTILNFTIKDCDAGTGNGGGIKITSSSADVTLGDGTAANGVYVSGCKAANGGGVHSVGKLTITQGVMISGCEATADGGGIHSSKALVMEAGQVEGNKASDGGGVLFGGKFTMTGGGIYKNTATNRGGGAYCDGGTLFMGGNAIIGEIGSNAATEAAHSNMAKNGGGIYVASGGGVYVGYTDEDTVDGSLDGGFDYNYASEDGGGIMAVAGTTVKVAAGFVACNGSANSGGGICCAGSLSLSGGAIERNNAKDGGGVAAAESGASFTMTGGKIEGNTVSGNGGGVHVATGATMTMGGGVVGKAASAAATSSSCSNKAVPGAGGGIYSKGSLTLNSGSLVCWNFSGTADQGCGGGICSDGGTVTINNGAEITYNGCAGRGGGIRAFGGGVTMNGGTIGNNSTTHWGGGVILQNSATFTMTGGSIKSNSSTNSGLNYGGGGIWIDGGTFTMSGDSVVQGNSSGGKGGGIHVEYAESVVEIKGGSVSGNTASKRGGGISSRGILNISGGKISSNKTTSAASSGADGGIGLYTDGGTVTMTGGEISENKGTATYVRGGGIRLDGGTVFKMSGGKVTKNECKHLGGNLFTQNAQIELSGTAEISYGKIETSNNDALGAAMWLEGGGTRLTMTGGKIFGNTAKTTGSGKNACAGIWLNYSKALITGGEISGNENLAGGNLGGGLWVNSTATLQIGESAHIPYGGSAGKNEIYLNGDAKVIVSAGLSQHSESDRIAITPKVTDSGTTILEAGSGVNLSSESAKFTLTDSSRSISTDGKIQ